MSVLVNLVCQSSVPWHETCKCKYRLDWSAYNNKQRWNNDKCRCECKELIGKGRCEKDLLGIVVIVNKTVRNYVMLENI